MQPLFVTTLLLVSVQYARNQRERTVTDCLWMFDSSSQEAMLGWVPEIQPPKSLQVLIKHHQHMDRSLLAS